MTVRAVLWLAVSTTAQANDDKASLPVQEAEARAICAENAWQIVDILRVPGHSRRYVDIHECARDMRAEGIDAFDRLLEHWAQRDFDILVCRDGSRFARTQSLHAYVVERTIDVGARIYSLNDGFIDESNYRMWISMGGYQAAGEIDQLMRRRKMGQNALIERGLPTNSVLPESHVMIRNPQNGKALRVELNPAKRQEWQHLAELMLQGLSYHSISKEMFDRFGYGTPFGEPYNTAHYWNLLYTPSFWGHLARHFKHKHRGSWIWDEREPVPDGVVIVRNSHDPVYTGEQAERIKAELTRRHYFRGKANPERSYRFTGLFYCRECGYSMGYSIERRPKYKNPYRALKCRTAYDRIINSGCTHRKWLNEKKAVAAVRQLLDRLQTHGLIAFAEDGDGVSVKAEELQALGDEIQRLDMVIRRLVVKQTSVDESLSYIYDDQITAEGQRLKSLREEHRQLQSDLAAKSESDAQERAQEELKTYNIDDLLQWDETELNQFLHRLLGKRRFLVDDGQIVGIGILPSRRSKRF